MSIKCSFSFDGVKRKRGGKKLGDYDPDKLRDIEKRALDLHRKLSVDSQRFADIASEKAAEVAKSNAVRESVFLQDIGELVDLKGVDLNRLEVFLSNRFNLKAKAAGLSADLDYTVPGKLRENIATTRQAAKGAIEESVRLIGVKEVRRHSKTIEDILRGAGVTDRGLINELRIDSIEIGQIPKLRQTYKIGEAADRINMQRYNDFITRLSDEFGISQEGIDAIVSSANEITATMDEARLIANSFGLDVGEIEGIGYVARVYTPNAKRYLDHLQKASESAQTYKNAENSLGFLNTDVTKSRTTFKYIPEDDAVVAYQLGLEVDELSDLMATGNLTKYMHENVSDELLENMVDIGSISKLPMTTKETYEYMVAKFGEQLPFKGMDDIFITDPTRIAEYYVNNLQEAAGKSAMARTVVREGTKNGWAVPDAVYKLRPDDFKNYRKLDAESIRQFYPEYSGDNFVWVNPYVDDTWRSVMGMSTSPSVLNTFAQNVKYFGSFFNQALLTNPGYPLRVLYDSFRNFGAAGGNWLRFSEGWSDMLKVTKGGAGLDALDDTRKVYKGLSGELISERQLYRDWIRHRGADFAPQTAANKVTSDIGRDRMQELIDAPFNIAKSANYLLHYTKAFGGVEGAKAGFDMLKSAQGGLFNEFAGIAAFFEASTKWGLVKSLADTRASNRVAAQVSGLGVARPEFKDMREMLRHIDDYFPQWGDVGDIPAFFNDAIRPFSIFAMYNPPAQIRQAMRRPQEFINYWRINSFRNQQSGAFEDDDLNEATFPEWARYSAPQFLFKDKESGEWVTMLNSNWDARADAWAYIAKGEKDLARAQGRYVGSTKNQQELIEDGRPDLLDYFKDYMAESQPILRNALSLMTKTDLRSGQPLDKDSTRTRTSIFGLPYEAEYVLSMYPPIQRAIDSNPFEIFGRPEFRDPKTGEVVIESKAGLFGSRRVDFDISQYRQEKRDKMIRAVGLLGFSIKLIDTSRNMQYNFSESNRLYKQTKADVSKLRNDLTLEYINGESAKFSEDYERRLELYNTKVEQLAQLGRDTMIIAGMMQERGIKPTEVFDKIDQGMLRSVKGRVGDDVLRNAINDLELYLTQEELEEQYNGNTK